MTRKKRLAGLEHSLTERWRAAWEAHTIRFNHHAGDLFSDPEGLTEALERTGFSPEEIEAQIEDYLTSWGVTQFGEFEVWFILYDLPDEPVDLSRWPHHAPAPPDEQPGEWEKVTPYRKSDDPIKRTAAETYRCLLASARAVREEREGGSFLGGTVRHHG